MQGESSNICVRGTHFTIEFLQLPDGSQPAREFLDCIDKGHRQFNKKVRLQALFKLFADTPSGRFLNREVFKELEDGLFEFKAHQLRIFCFFMPGRRLVLVDGVIKKSDKHNRADLAKAQKMRAQFLARINDR